MVLSRHLVAVLALEGVIPFELGIPARLFGMARGPDGQRLYDVVTCTLTPGRLATNADFDIVVDEGPEVLARADTVVIPASYHVDLAIGDNGLPEPLAEALASLKPGTRLASICTASFILAAAGLLDGRRATTHWMHAEALARAFPKVDVDADVLFVDEGDVLTSAGVAAGVDLCLHMVRRDHGSKVANAVARRSVVPPWRDGGQSQYIEQPVPSTAAASTAEVRAWAIAHLDERVSIAGLARRARMSVRTFTRRFHDETGAAPGQWLLRQRVEAARVLLETTDLSADRIAARTGLGTSASLRRHFHAQVGVAPMTYRKTFHANQ
ncbi:GlxA family transcriptional regulator [Stackebrandtia nassauensis]|nr:helix-turn-helix domain-containing protein [Stackebrandtia nassauensis]